MPDESGATVFALSTPPGIGGIAVIRITGGAADTVLQRIAPGRLPKPRYATLKRIMDGTGVVLDEALVLRFVPPASYTGEPLVELHCHGGRAVVGAVLSLLSAQAELRPAEPGEFTRRAFINGRMDLTEVEAIGDLLSAETEAQRRFAMQGVGGALRRRSEGWRSALLHALTLLEVTIDWADEEVPEDVEPEVREALERLADELADQISGFAASERIRHGFEVALVGAPNAGKSTLLNALAGRDAALISPVPGTTRDVLEVHYDLEGIAVTFLDTAGLRRAEDEVERQGVERAVERARNADIRLFLLAGDAPSPSEAAELKAEDDIVVATKTDTAPALAEADVAISAVTGEGMKELLALVKERLSKRLAAAGLIGHIRQKSAVEEADGAIRAALGVLEGAETELAAEHLWQAVRALEGLAGRLGREELLESVFQAFCLGK